MLTNLWDSSFFNYTPVIATQIPIPWQQMKKKNKIFALPTSYNFTSSCLSFVRLQLKISALQIPFFSHIHTDRTKKNWNKKKQTASKVCFLWSLKLSFHVIKLSASENETIRYLLVYFLLLYLVWWAILASKFLNI